MNTPMHVSLPHIYTHVYATCLFLCSKIVFFSQFPIEKVIVADERPSMNTSAILEALATVDKPDHLVDDQKRRRIAKELGVAGLAQSLDVTKVAVEARQELITAAELAADMIPAGDHPPSFGKSKGGISLAQEVLEAEAASIPHPMHGGIYTQHPTTHTPTTPSPSPPTNAPTMPAGTSRTCGAQGISGYVYLGSHADVEGHDLGNQCWNDVHGVCLGSSCTIVDCYLKCEANVLCKGFLQKDGCCQLKGGGSPSTVNPSQALDGSGDMKDGIVFYKCDAISCDSGCTG